MKTRTPLVLASSSPRRAAILELLGLPFIVHAPAVVEPAAVLGAAPAQTALARADHKARACIALAQRHLVLAADTVVCLDGQILDKPPDAAAALAMLTALSGRHHHVITAVVLQHGDQRVAWCETTTVEVANVPCTWLLHYLASYCPYDKAGAYGIQEWFGAAAIRAIHGDYYNVVGLPAASLMAQLEAWGELEV
jgi:septum formation protein